MSSNKPYSSYLGNKKVNHGFQTINTAIKSDRDTLYNRINSRVDKMIDDGLEKEVFELKQFKNLNTMNTVGYKEFINYFENNVSYGEAVNKIKQNTRNYAKRQITWFKRYKNSRRINIEENYNLDIKNLNI
jgi:tRNA dimethylallyltransferase